MRFHSLAFYIILLFTFLNYFFLQAANNRFNTLENVKESYSKNINKLVAHDYMNQDISSKGKWLGDKEKNPEQPKDYIYDPQTPLKYPAPPYYAL